MLNGLERRYTLEQIEAQHEDKIKPRLNYNALTTLRNPMYVKLAQQVQDASKEQADARLAHHQTQQVINNIANHNGVNAAELEQIMQNLVNHPQVPTGYPPPPPPPSSGGGGDSMVGLMEKLNKAKLDSLKRGYEQSKDPENTQGGTLDHWGQGSGGSGSGSTTAAVMPNNEMYRLNVQLTAENQLLTQKADYAARQDAARREITTPHREELRSIVQYFHHHTGQDPVPPPPVQDNSQLIGALQTIVQQQHALGSVLEQKNITAQQMVELAHHSMQAQAEMKAQTGPNAPTQIQSATSALETMRPPAPKTRLPRSRSPLIESKLDPKKDARMPGRPPSPPQLPEIKPPPVQPPPSTAREPTPQPVIPTPQTIVPDAPREPTPQPRLGPKEARVRSRSNTAVKAPKLAPQATPVQPASSSSSSKGDEMRAIIAILEGPEQAREEPDKEAFLDNPVERKRDTRRRESAPPRRSTPEPAPMQPQNPPMEVKPAKPPMDAKPAKPQIKKSATILKQLKAQDKKAEDKKAETKEILKKGMDEFFSKQASKAPPKASKAPKSRAVSVPPPKLPTPSFDEIAAQLDQDSFLDNPVDRKRDTRRREAATSSMRGNATSVGATQASNRSVSARPPSGARVLKTQRADSEGRRRTTLNTMVR